MKANSLSRQKKPEDNLKLISRPHLAGKAHDRKSYPLHVMHKDFPEIVKSLKITITDNKRAILFAELQAVSSVMRRMMHNEDSPQEANATVQKMGDIADALNKAAAELDALSPSTKQVLEEALYPLVTNIFSGAAVIQAVEKLNAATFPLPNDPVPWSQLEGELPLAPAFEPFPMVMPDSHAEVLQGFLRSAGRVVRTAAGTQRKRFPSQGGAPGDVWRKEALQLLANTYELIVERRPTASKSGAFVNFCDAVFRCWGWPEEAFLGLSDAVGRVVKARKLEGRK